MGEVIAFGVALVKLRTGVDIPTWNAKVTQGRAHQIFWRGSRGPIREDYSFNWAQKLTWTTCPSPIEVTRAHPSKTDNRSRSEKLKSEGGVVDTVSSW